MREAIIVEGNRYKWIYNDSTGLGEIQVEAGVLCDQKIYIALQGDTALAFHNTDPAQHGPMIQQEWIKYQAKRASRR
jgi:hypothetical protein